MSEQYDDTEVEVSSLDLPAAPSTTATGDDSSQTDTASVGSLQATPQRIALVARRPQRQQALRAMGVLAILSILLSTVLLIPTGNRDAVLRLLITPASSPTAHP